MQDTGYIKLFRSILGWEWYGDVNTRLVFIHLLLTVNYTDQKWNGTVIKRGQRATSYLKFSSEVGLSVQSVRTAIKRLISTGELTYRSTAKYGLFTVVNYDKYQQLTDRLTSEQQAANTLVTSCQQAANTQLTTIKESKKERKKEGKKEKKGREYTFAQEVQEIFNEVCVFYPKCSTISKNRRELILARQNAGYSLEDFRTLFEKAQASDFLKGDNDRNWTASFDWLIKEANMVKVLEGNYDNRGNSQGDKKQPSGNPFLAMLDSEQGGRT